LPFDEEDLLSGFDDMYTPEDMFGEASNYSLLGEDSLTKNQVFENNLSEVSEAGVLEPPVSEMTSSVAFRAPEPDPLPASHAQDVFAVEERGGALPGFGRALSQVFLSPLANEYIENFCKARMFE